MAASKIEQQLNAFRMRFDYAIKVVEGYAAEIREAGLEVEAMIAGRTDPAVLRSRLLRQGLEIVKIIPGLNDPRSAQTVVSENRELLRVGAWHHKLAACPRCSRRHNP